MKSEYTYTELLSAIQKHGYALSDYDTNSFTELDGLTGTNIVQLEPSLAKKLFEYNIKIQEYNRTINSNRIKEENKKSAMTPVIELESDYKIRKGHRFIEYVSKQEEPVETTITVFNKDQTLESLFCDLIKDAVTDFYNSQNVSLEEIDSALWHKSFLENLAKSITDFNVSPYLFTNLLREKDPNAQYNDPTIVAIINGDRSNPYPDKIAYIESTMHDGTIKMLPCDLIPSLQYSNVPHYCLKPGLYNDIISANESNEYFIQARETEISVAVLEKNKIKSYEPTDNTFMRIMIPLNNNEVITESGIVPVGAKFETDEIKNEFLETINFSNIRNEKVRYIVLESSDFED